MRHLLLRLFLWELRDWLLRSPLLASLYAFPSHSPWGPLQELHYARGEASHSFYLQYARQINLSSYHKKKEDVNATSLASFVLVGAEGFEPPTLCL